MRAPGELILYTDGAWDSKNDRGGFAAILVNPTTMKHIEIADGPYSGTTNNQMEMMAVIAGMRFVHRRIGPRKLLILSDSKYVINGITDWIHNWKRNGWFTAGNKPVKNAALWQKMEKARGLHEITRFEWVRGHNGDRFNEMADEAAVRMRTMNTKPKQLGQTA